MGTDTAGDNELMLRVAEGDTSAFDAIYRRHQTRAFLQAMRITGRPSVAEEVTQDAFLGLWNSASCFDPNRGSLTTWLLSLVRNRGIDSIRRRARHDRVLEIDDAIADRLEAAERTDEQVVKRDQSRQMRELLTELPDDQREVIQLSYFTGLSQTEIAKEIDIPLGTVKGRQRLALTKLHRLLAGESLLSTS
jgi:RNA polymerase sigma-70 factor (ECF subfamily)